jgi:hypothetical protein
MFACEKEVDQGNSTTYGKSIGNCVSDLGHFHMDPSESGSYFLLLPLRIRIRIPFLRFEIQKVSYLVQVTGTYITGVGVIFSRCPGSYSEVYKLV